MTRVPRISYGEALVFLCLFLDLAGFGMVLADVQLRAQLLTPPHWPTGAVIGAILASTFVIQTIVSPYWGRLSDRVGRKSVLIACTVLSALAMTIYGLGETIEAIFVSRVIAGMGGANVAIAQALLADRYEGDARTKAMGRLGAAVSLGLVLGPVLGGWLAVVEGHRVMGLLAAGASGIGVVGLLFLPSDKPKQAADLAPRRSLHFALLRDLPAVRPYILIALVAWLSLATLEGTFARLIQHLFHYDQREFGLLFGYEAFLGFAIQTLGLGILLSRFRESKMLKVAFLLQGLGLALNPAAALLKSWLVPIASLFFASTLYAMGSGVANPTLNGLTSRLVPSDRQGELFGLLQGARSIGFVVGPIVGGILFDAWPPAPYLLAGMVCLLAAILAPSGVAKA